MSAPKGKTTERTHAADGSLTMSEIHRRAAARREGLELVTRCSIWRCEWSFSGALADGRNAFLEHRKTEHPTAHRIAENEDRRRLIAAGKRTEEPPMESAPEAASPTPATPAAGDAERGGSSDNLAPANDPPRAGSESESGAAGLPPSGAPLDLLAELEHYRRSGSLFSDPAELVEEINAHARRLERRAGALRHIAQGLLAYHAARPADG